MGWDLTGQRVHSRRRDFNPPTPHGVGPEMSITRDKVTGISIHPPRMGWDRSPATPLTPMRYFNPPTPHGVGPWGQSQNLRSAHNFNPPTPHGVGRGDGCIERPGNGNFNPPTPHGVGHNNWVCLYQPIYFNPPTPHGVGPEGALYYGETRHDFNPPTPHGVGLAFELRAANFTLVFQSTHPAWGGTSQNALYFSQAIVISIHPPRMGWDLIVSVHLLTDKDYFNPPTPHGVGR